MAVRIKGNTIGDILDTITNNKIIGSLIPTVAETNATIARKISKDGSKFLNKSLRHGVGNEILELQNTKLIDEDVANRLLAQTDLMNSKDLEGSFKSLKKAMKKEKVDIEDINDVINNSTRAFNSLKSSITPDTVSTIMGPDPISAKARYIGKMPGAYFGVEDKTKRAIRRNVAISGYVGTTIGGRLLSGGSLTEDQYGRKDIAGIPFI